MSHARLRQRPPPMAGPLMAAITGWCRRRRVRVMSSSISIERSAYVGRVSPSTYGGTPADSWSAPEQKPRPAPVITTARRELSCPRSTSCSRNGTITSNAIAFIRSGRLRVTTATSGTGRVTRTKFTTLTVGPPVVIESTGIELDWTGVQHLGFDHVCCPGSFRNSVPLLHLRGVGGVRRAVGAVRDETPPRARRVHPPAVDLLVGQG